MTPRSLFVAAENMRNIRAGLCNQLGWNTTLKSQLYGFPRHFRSKGHSRSHVDAFGEPRQGARPRPVASSSHEILLFFLFNTPAAPSRVGCRSSVGRRQIPEVTV